MNLPDRLLHHSIDAATHSAGPRRSRNRKPSIAADIALTSVPFAIAAIFFLNYLGVFQ